MQHGAHYSGCYAVAAGAAHNLYRAQQGIGIGYQEPDLTIVSGLKISVGSIWRESVGFVESNVAYQLHFGIALCGQNHVLILIDQGQDVGVGCEVTKAER